MEEISICYEPDNVHKNTDKGIKIYVGKSGYFGNTEETLMTQFIESMPFQKCEKIACLDDQEYFVANGGSLYKYFYILDDDYVKEYNKTHEKDKSQLYKKLFDVFAKSSLSNTSDWADLMGNTIKAVQSATKEMIDLELENSEDSDEKTSGWKF